ncbi:DUF6666 family protein [Planctomycetes bacterium K23_9]|uniref:Stigma-specific protein, Stig1 n=1 Tax=Stieleria marina TaxID=1930275 RepID=A0A517NT73_9BACT|nr:hypothetical protein K239x_22780 [Planctomycetes bacterium K23_9]
MITRQSRLGLLSATVIFASFCASTVFQPATAEAQNRLRPQTQRSAATGLAGSAETPYVQDRIDVGHARLVTAQPRRQSMIAQAAYGQAINEIPPAPLDGSLVQQTSFLGGGCDGGCGPVCDCMEASCGVEVGCGVELIEPSCGCGLEIGCGCGVEIMEPGCGCVGECSCGVEFMGPSCGMEADCGCDSCASVSNCCPGGLPVFLPFVRMGWNRMNLFAGVQGYTGPMNCANINANDPTQMVGAGSSFGFYQGFNEGRSLRKLLGFDLSAQLGLRATQSNLSGSKITNETRHQIFLTAGLFRRVDYGLQYGVVFDYLNEDWYFQGDVTQIRGELSFNTGNCNIFGVHFMSGTNSDSSTTAVRDLAGSSLISNVDFEALNQVRAFYRRELACNGDWSVFVGGTDGDNTVMGCSVNQPLGAKVLFNAGATYVNPNEDEGQSFHDEAWNLSMGFTFRPGGVNSCNRYGRPMFDVADNGTFIVQRK